MGHSEGLTESADSLPEGPISSLPRAGSVKESEFPFLPRSDAWNQPRLPEGHYQLKGGPCDRKHGRSLSPPPKELCIGLATLHGFIWQKVSGRLKVRQPDRAEPMAASQTLAMSTLAVMETTSPLQLTLHYLAFILARLLASAVVLLDCRP